jgi:hypothetical protein
VGQIDQLGLSSLYNVLKSEITGANGTAFIFAGIRQNVSNIKSYESVDIMRRSAPTASRRCGTTATR